MKINNYFLCAFAGMSIAFNFQAQAFKGVERAAWPDLDNRPTPTVVAPAAGPADAARRLHERARGATLELDGRAGPGPGGARLSDRQERARAGGV